MNNKSKQFRKLLDGGYGKEKIQKKLGLSEEEYFDLYGQQTDYVRAGLVLLVRNGFIADYKYQRRRLKYERKKLIEKRAEVLARNDNQGFSEIFYEKDRLHQAEIKLDCDEITIGVIRDKASDIPEVNAKLSSLNALKL